LLGLGRESVTAVPVDAQGRIEVGCLPECGPSTVVVVQSGNVNSGSFDDLVRVAEVVERSGAWMHVDGAFGVWARASARYGSLVEGLERADSFAASAHKLLNVPYDSAIAACRHADVMEGALAATTSYAVVSDGREPNHFTPEGSRRARGIDVWAVLKSLGSSGLAAHVESCCANARRFAEVLGGGGVSVLNDVVFNQVLFDLGPAPRRDELLAAIQREGTCWIGPTVWHARPACRASFCNWATTEADAERSARAVLAARGRATAK
jgi:glutamate/tyrosine decarboxylase-like PLP-dependent enzyme